MNRVHAKFHLNLVSVFDLMLGQDTVRNTKIKMKAALHIFDFITRNDK